MPDHDPDRLRKFRRDRINELGLVRLGTDRQTTTTTTTTARLSPLSLAPRYAKTLFAHSRYAKTLVASNGDFHYLSPLASLGD